MKKSWKQKGKELRCRMFGHAWGLPVAQTDDDLMGQNWRERTCRRCSYTQMLAPLSPFSHHDLNNPENDDVA